MYSLLKVVYLDILTLSVDENLTFVAVYKLGCDGYVVEGGCVETRGRDTY